MSEVTPASFWDRVAPKYALQPISNVEAYEQSLARTMSYLGPNDHVLELGCGTGSTALRLAPLVNRYVGTDISDAMIGIANDKAAEADIPGLRFQTIQSLPPDEEEFTRITAFNLLHLIPDLDQAIAEVRQRLTPGGLFISKTPCLSRKGYLKPVIWVMRKLGKAPWVNFLSPEHLRQRIEANGFEIIEDGHYPPSTPSAYFVARKV